jgi:minor extracellular serine protease Vpr
MKISNLMKVFVVVILTFSTIPNLYATQFSHSDRLVDVFVELNGITACDVMPLNYVQTNSLQLDKTLVSSTQSIVASVESFIANLPKDEIKTVYHKYGIVMRGFACRTTESFAFRLARMTAVSDVWEIPQYQPMLDTSVKAIGADKAWEMKSPSGVNLDGTGTLIGVIDTGLDYRHPDLGGKLGSKEKVVEGKDFAESGDGANDGQRHGTHVAGICAANGKVKGVAPGAKLAGYKVFTSEENKSTNVGANVNMALERAIISKCTVVNLSLGSPAGSTGSDKGDTMYHRVVDAGIIVVAAAGNNGARSPTQGTVVGSPSTYAPVISVAASDDSIRTIIEIVNPVKNPEKISANLFDIPQKWTSGEWDVVDCGYGFEEDFEGKDLTGKIALIQRGPKDADTKKAYFRNKDLNAAKAGAVGCIIYNHSPGPFNGTMIVDPGDEALEFIPALAITLNQGLKLKSLINFGLKVKITEAATASMIADFSSAGPSTDSKFKPEVTAPGVAIFSTVTTTPSKDSKDQSRIPQWAKMQGTSMASPHVAGACAILKQAMPTATPRLVKQIFMATADLMYNDIANEYIPLTSQGSGRINIPKALAVKAVFDPPSDAHQSMEVEGKVLAKYEIVNITKKPVTLDLSYYSVGATTTAIVTPSQLTVAGNSKNSFELEIICNEDTKGILEGIVFAKYGEESIHLPMIIVRKSKEIPEQLSELKVDKPLITMNSEEGSSVTLSFKINYGSTTETDKGNVVSNYASADLVLYGLDNKPIGKIFSNDSMQIGYYHIPWNGLDINKRLFASDGKYEIHGMGIRSKGNSDPITQRPHEVAYIELLNSPLIEVPSLQLSVIPESPRVGEQFLVKIKTSKMQKVLNLEMSLKYDKSFLKFVRIKNNTNSHGMELSSFVNHIEEESKIQFNIKMPEDGMDLDGTFITLVFEPHQEGITRLIFENAFVMTSLGSISTLSPGTVFQCIVSYSFYDLNKDGSVDELDFDELNKYLFLSVGDSGFRQEMDFDGSGTIDSDDLFMLASNFGKTMYPR